LARDYIHEVINHAEAYVRDNCHTNNCEKFWSPLKRGINGTYVFRSNRFIFSANAGEQAFRYNNRLPMSNSDRFSYLVRKFEASASRTRADREEESLERQLGNTDCL
jgi:hypothetical protein